MRNKKGQAGFGIVAFAGIVITLLFLAPVMLKIVRVTTSEVSDQLNITNPEASASMDAVTDSFATFWDFVLLMVFAVNVLILLISAFFIDTHPAFLLVYIIVAFFLVVFAPNVLDAVDSVWAESAFSEEVSLYLDSMNFLRVHFGVVLLSVIILSGVVMYAKFKYFAV